MTSAISRDDIEDELIRAGIISPHIRAHLMRKIELYARKYPVPEPLEDVPDPPLPGHHKYEYKCPACKKSKQLSEFPGRKKENRRVRIPCLACEPLDNANGT